MNLDKANSIANRLKESFDQDGKDYPSSEELSQAIEVFMQIVEAAYDRLQPKPELPTKPEGIQKSEFRITKVTIEALANLQDLVNRIERLAKEKIDLSNEVRDELPIIRAKLRL